MEKETAHVYTQRTHLLSPPKSRNTSASPHIPFKHVCHVPNKKAILVYYTSSLSLMASSPLGIWSWEATPTPAPKPPPPLPPPPPHLPPPSQTKAPRHLHPMLCPVIHTHPQSVRKTTLRHEAGRVDVCGVPVSGIVMLHNWDCQVAPIERRTPSSGSSPPGCCTAHCDVVLTSSLCPFSVLGFLTTSISSEILGVTISASPVGMGGGECGASDFAVMYIGRKREWAASMNGRISCEDER